MTDELLNKLAGAILTAYTSQKLIEDVRQERERVKAEMATFDATARMLRLKRDELGFLAQRLDAALPKLEALLERRGQPPDSTCSSEA